MLGLTLGESILLVLFSILLVLSIPLIQLTDENGRQKRHIAEVERREKTAQQQVSDLEKHITIIRALVEGRGIEDITIEYVRIRREVEMLASKIKAVESEAAAFRKIADVYGNDASLDPNGTDHIAGTVAEAIENLKIRDMVRQALDSSEKTQDGERLVDRIAQLVEDARKAKFGELTDRELVDLAARQGADLDRARAQLSNTQGQLQNFRRQVERSGRGVEAVPCWSTPEGHPEYIFDVALTTQGLVVRDRALEHRRAEQGRLPLQGIHFETEIAPEEFLVQTRALYDWSVGKDCRFFVRAFDVTAETEKLTFKRHLRVLETHFYKYEELNEKFQ